MRKTGLIGLIIAAPTLAAASDSASDNAFETREAYLSRLSQVCAVDCLTPRDLRRKARKRDHSDTADMAVMMDVAFVQRAGDRYELFNIDTSSSQLVDVEILRSAGINASSRNGVGGLPRGRRANVSPNVVIVSLDKQAFADFLNPPQLDGSKLKGEGAGMGEPGGPADEARVKGQSDADILVERAKQRERAVIKPTLAALKTRFQNRRIVVRGTPVLTAQWIGGRRDYRRKQVTLMVDNADDLVMLPRFDADGEPVGTDLPWIRASDQQDD